MNPSPNGYGATRPTLRPVIPEGWQQQPEPQPEPTPTPPAPQEEVRPNNISVLPQQPRRIGFGWLLWIGFALAVAAFIAFLLAEVGREEEKTKQQENERRGGNRSDYGYDDRDSRNDRRDSRDTRDDRDRGRNDSGRDHEYTSRRDNGERRENNNPLLNILPIVMPTPAATGGSSGNGGNNS